MKFDFDRVVKRTGTDSVKWDHYEMKEEVRDMIPMSIADMDFKTPGFITDAIVKRARHGIFGYTVVPESYRNSAASWFSKRSGWRVERDWIRFSPGVIPALNLAIQAFTSPGDKVLIQPPVYHPFRHSITNNGRVVVNNPLKREGGVYTMDLDGLKRSIDADTKMIILSSPHNPVGRVWSADELKDLVTVCLENDILILSDEIHSDLIMPGFVHTPVATLSSDAAQATITCTSPSKTFNLAELHVANIIIPNPGLYERFDNAFVKVGLNRPNVLGMVACEAAYSGGDEWVEELVAYIHRNYILMRDFLSVNLPEAVVSPMEGTYLGWIDLRGFGRPYAELEKALLTDARVAMTPGTVFGPGGEGHFRMNLATSASILKEALGRMRGALGAMRRG